MVEVFREVRRVLRDDGTLWLNLGDSYNGSGGAGGDYASGGLKAGQPKYPGRRISALKPKDLVGIPWRVAFALQADGWYLRSDIIWSKPNPMPESVTDRPTKSHEYVFLLAKQARYFYDADAVREVAAYPNDGRGARSDSRRSVPGANCINPGYGKTSTHRNRRTVWKIPTQPTPDAHFATFPEKLVEPCIRAGTSERGACPKCGAPWRRSTSSQSSGSGDHRAVPGQNKPFTIPRGDYLRSTTGWEPPCTCTGDPVPCVVLDPFGGSGTVAKVARDLGRSSILIEINPEYVQIAKKRLRIGEQLDSGVCEYVVKSFLTEATP
jgi:DNA modification methylase